MKFILLPIAFVCLVQCTVFLPGPCPTDRPIVKDFDVQKYSGLWYEYYRKNDSYIFLGDCNTISYIPYENGTIGIKEFRVLPEPIQEQIDTTFAVFSDTNQKPIEGRWNVSYHWNDPYFENHRILDTDYETYSITYVCLPAGDFRSDEFLVYTRKPQITEDMDKKIVDVVSKYYDMSLLFKPKHELAECQRKDNLVD